MKKHLTDVPGSSHTDFQINNFTAPGGIGYLKICKLHILFNTLKKLTLICIIISIVFSIYILPANASEAHEASDISWSGFWWPSSAGGLINGNGYRGHPAPLEKYEMLTRGITRGPLVMWFNRTHYNPNDDDWYGLCADWARAACYENIEILPSSENNIFFRVGDKKGLLTLAHTKDMVERADGTKPENLHFWLLNYIKDQKKAFAADLDPSTQVWTYPIYRYSMESTIQGSKESVTVSIFYADDNVHPDYMGTKELGKTYTYDLFIDEDGGISGGEWTGWSIDDHPHGLSFPLSVGEVSPYLDYDEVVRLANSRDDFLEKPGESVQINPGTYNLILMDEDRYVIECLPGNNISIELEKQNGSYENMVAIVSDSNGDEVKNTVVDYYESMFLTLTADNPPYTISITQNNYSDPNFYTLKYDLRKSFSQRIPYIAKTGIWSGFALTNSSEAEVKGVTLVTGSENGHALQTVLGPLDMSPGEKKLFFFDDLPWRLHELADTYNLNLLSQAPVNLLNIAGTGICFTQGEAKGSRLIIPDTVPPMTPGKFMFGEAANESFEDTVVMLRLYSGDGALSAESSEIINPRSSLSISPGSYPFYSMPNSSWIEIAGSEDSILSGYQYVKSGYRTEALFALPVRSSQKIVPHIPEPGYWITTVTLINPNDQENKINFHLKLAGDDNTDDMNIVLGSYEKRVLELQDQFGGREGDQFYHSILEISGEYPIAGYYTYSTISSKEDEASIQLIDQNDFRKTIILPHYAGNDGYWWTGVGVFNPSSFPVSVKIEPYDHDGNIMSSSEKYLKLSIGAYEVFDAGAFFKETASDISFIKFHAEEPGGLIGGFYLYGSSSNEILCGANM